MSLDPNLNTVPDKVQHIHLMGICGTGVGALAGMLKKAGYHISGSDQHVYPPMSDFLTDQGITILEGYQKENLIPRPDLVIVGNVITKINPEAVALAEEQINYLSMPQALGHFFLSGKKSLVVTGTHGKTTTSSLLATMLYEANLAPGFMIGGIVQAFSSNFRIGTGDYFVVEGDEYDTAFFDKGPKFLHYQAQVAIITSIEFDHADIYNDLDAIKASFTKLVHSMPEAGYLIAHLDDPVVREIVENAPCAVLGYGFSPDLFWSIKSLKVGQSGTSFSVYKQGRKFGDFHNVMPGRHNALNSVAVIAALDIIGLSPSDISPLLKKFKGVRRRQEVRGVVQGVTVIDDFAHHPTAVRETLTALREVYPNQRLIAVFEPRTNSSRRNIFQNAYTKVFDSADQIIVKNPQPLTNIPAPERFSSQKLVDDLVKIGFDSHHFETTDEIISFLCLNSKNGDVIVIMSNGGFDTIHSRLLDNLQP